MEKTEDSVLAVVLAVERLLEVITRTILLIDHPDRRVIVQIIIIHTVHIIITIIDIITITKRET